MAGLDSAGKGWHVFSVPDLPLDGVRVLDFSQFLAGPVAAMRLADLGARVTKVERPHTGEIGRTLAFAGLRIDGDTASFHAMNRNKRSVVADLKNPDDLALVRELAARADVIVENFRPGVMARLGLGYETLRAVNPGLVYASATGYGSAGPWTRRPGQDLLAQSVSGLTWTNARENRPLPVGLAVADHLMSCHIAQGVTALLVRKARSGVGGLVETSLLEAMLDLQFEHLTARLSNGQAAIDESARALHGIYATQDGYIALAGVPEEQVRGILDLANRAGEHFGVPATGESAGRDDLLTARLREEPTSHWLELFSAHGPWCAPVLSLEDLLEDESFSAARMTQQVVRPGAGPDTAAVRITTTRSPIRIDGRILANSSAAPRLGQDGHVRDEVLRDAARVESARCDARPRACRRERAAGE